MDSTEFPLLLKSPCLFLLLVGISVAGLIWFYQVSRIREIRRVLLETLHRDGECELHHVDEEINPIHGTFDIWLSDHVLRELQKEGVVTKREHWLNVTGRTHEVYQLTDKGRELTVQLFGSPPHP